MTTVQYEELYDLRSRTASCAKNHTQLQCYSQTQVRSSESSSTTSTSAKQTYVTHVQHTPSTPASSQHTVVCTTLQRKHVKAPTLVASSQQYYLLSLLRGKLRYREQYFKVLQYSHGSDKYYQYQYFQRCSVLFSTSTIDTSVVLLKRTTRQSEVSMTMTTYLATKTTD